MVTPGAQLYTLLLPGLQLQRAQVSPAHEQSGVEGTAGWGRHLGKPNPAPPWPSSSLAKHRMRRAPLVCGEPLHEGCFWRESLRATSP